MRASTIAPEFEEFYQRTLARNPESRPSAHLISTPAARWGCAAYLFVRERNQAGVIDAIRSGRYRWPLRAQSIARAARLVRLLEPYRDALAPPAKIFTSRLRCFWSGLAVVLAFARSSLVGPVLGHRRATGEAAPGARKRTGHKGRNRSTPRRRLPSGRHGCGRRAIAPGPDRARRVGDFFIARIHVLQPARGERDTGLGVHLKESDRRRPRRQEHQQAPRARRAEHDQASGRADRDGQKEEAANETTAALTRTDVRNAESAAVMAPARHSRTVLSVSGG